MKKSMQYGFLPALLVGIVLIVPGCEWLKNLTSPKTTASSAPRSNAVMSEAIISFGDQGRVTAEEFEKYFQLVMQSQNGLQNIFPFLTAEQRQQFLDEIINSRGNEAVMVEYVQRSGIDTTPEYKANAEFIHAAVDRDLAVRTFQNELLKELSVSDSEAERYYRENKDKPAFKRPPFTKTMGGVKAMVMNVANEKEAKDFAEQAKKGDFATVAKNAKKTVQTHENINYQTPGVDANIRAKAMSLGELKAGAIEVVKGVDNKWYVMKVMGTKEPEYASFAEVKDAVKDVVMGEEFNNRLMKRLDELKKQYNFKVNKEAVDKVVQKLIPSAVEEKSVEEQAGMGEEPQQPAAQAA